MNAHNFIKVSILQHISSYTFRASLAHNQGARNCTERYLNFSVRIRRKTLTMYYLRSRASCALKAIKFETCYNCNEQ